MNDNTTTPHVAALYLRVSSKRQAADDKLSLRTQQLGCERRAAELKVPVGSDLIFQEIHSGEDLMWSRSVFMSQLVAAAREHRFDTLIVYDLDRFSRGGSGPGLDAMGMLEACGVTIHSVTFDLEAISQIPIIGRTIKTLILDFAAYDNRQRVEKATRTKYARVTEEGRMVLGKRPTYGYQYDDPQMKRKLVANPDTAPVVQRIFSLVAEGHTMLQTSAILNTDHVLPPSAYAHQRFGAVNERVASGWHGETIRLIIRDSTYRGERLVLRTSGEARNTADRERLDLKTVQKRVPREGGAVVLRDVAEALVDDDLWWRANSRVDEARRFHPPRLHERTAEEALCYGGMVRCHTCGRSMAPQHRKRGVLAWSYKCTHGGANRTNACPAPVTMRTRDLDDYVWQRACQIMTDAEYLETLLAQSEDALSAARRVEHYQRLIDQETKPRDNLMKQLRKFDEDVPAEAEAAASLRRDISECNRQLDYYREQLNKAQTAQDSEQRKRTVLRQFRERMAETRGRLSHLTRQEQREILLSLGTTIECANLDDPEGFPRISVVFNLTHKPEAVRHLDPRQRQHGDYDPRTQVAFWSESRIADTPPDSPTPSPDESGILHLDLSAWRASESPAQPDPETQSKTETNTSSRF